jgi:hypothetical protein
MKLIASIIGFAFLFAACGSDENNDNRYTNDFESIGHWGAFPKVTRELSHSGLFSAYTDKDNEFSMTFQLNSKDLKQKKPKHIHASCWAAGKVATAEGLLVISVDKDGKNLLWQSYGLKSIIQAPMTWYKLECGLSIPDNLPDGATFKVYGWSNGTQSLIFWDDFNIEFE